MVSKTLSKRIYGVVRLMAKMKAISLSLLDAVWFGTYTVGPIMFFLWAIGFIQINF